MAVRLSRGERASRRNSNFFFEYLAPAETNVTPGGADSSLASFARCALFFFSIPRGIWTSNGVRRLLSTEIKNKSANRLPFANHDNEIYQGTHYLDRFFKSYIAVAERSNREHLPLSLSLFFLEKNRNRYNFSRRHESRTIIFAFLFESGSRRFRRRDRNFFLPRM